MIWLSSLSVLHVLCLFFPPKVTLHSELVSSENSDLRMGKDQTPALTLGIKNSLALNLYSHSSKKWKRRDNMSCPVCVKQSRQSEHVR